MLNKREDYRNKAPYCTHVFAELSIFPIQCPDLHHSQDFQNLSSFSWYEQIYVCTSIALQTQIYGNKYVEKIKSLSKFGLL